MILVQNHLRQSNGNKNLYIVAMRVLFLFLGLLFFSVSIEAQQIPEKFVSHKVKKKETLFGLSEKYNVTIEQIKQFNPMIDKIGLKKKMILQVPVYPIVEIPVSKTLSDDLMYYPVKPKETKWRLAYRYGITIKELEALNPQIVEGLKFGQEIIVPKRSETETNLFEEKYNYYKVKPKEGFYRIEKKLGVTESELIALNENLLSTGLQEGMILKVPLKKTGNLKIENDLLVEKSNLLDSVFDHTFLKVVTILPFMTSEIEFDSIEQTLALLKKRNLHTLSIDFLMGMMMAFSKADSLGIRTVFEVIDSQNDKSTLLNEIDRINWSSVNLVVGPLIPSNFDFVSQQQKLQGVPMLAPLSSRPIEFRSNVYQSVASTEKMRERMTQYLTQVIDTSQNVMIIADKVNASFAKKLEFQYPFAHRVRPEEGGFVLPDLIDSLLVDSIPNKVIFESQDLNLAANVTSLLNSQVSKERDVQLFTTFRSPIYDNANISRKDLGNLKFTYVGGSHPTASLVREEFEKAFQARFGDYPGKDSFRAYDVTLDALLRLGYQNSILIDGLGETDYLENRFLYEPNLGQGYQNIAFYLLQHQGYEIIEIKK